MQEDIRLKTGLETQKRITISILYLVFQLHIGGKPNSDYEFKYTASESSQGDLGLARIDFLVNKEVIKRLFDSLSGDTVTINLGNYTHQKVRCRIAAWDQALNCALSEEKELEVE